MRLWTTQPLEVCDIIERTGTFTGSWDRVDPDYLAAYRWMASQMERRRIVLNGHAPVWAWRSYNPPHRDRPDLRCGGHGLRGTRCVLIELELPDVCVLVSEFDAWHAVLNRSYLSLSESEDAAMERAGISEAALVQSWERIFDLTTGDPAWRGAPAERLLQATIAKIDRAWVRSMRPFTAR